MVADPTTNPPLISTSLPSSYVKSILFLLSVSAVMALCHSASAGTAFQGAKAAGMGTAFIAVADDPSAILHNPAGIAGQKGSRIYLGVSGLIISGTFEDEAGRSERADDKAYFPPHLFLTSDLGTDRFVFGLGIYSPFGIGGWTWDEQGLTRYLATESLTGTLSANPTAAMQVNDWMQIGVGVDFLYSLTSAERRTDQSIAQAGDGRVEMDSDGTGVGFNMGVMFHLPSDLRLGIIYRSPIRVNETGDFEIKNIAPALQPVFGGSKFETEFESDITFPEVLGLAVGLPVSDRWMLTLEAEWVRWSRMDKRKIDLRDEIPAAGVTDMEIRMDWEDVWMLKAGVEYKVTGNIALRTGYAFMETPVPDATLSPDYPDADKHYASLGLGWRSGRFFIDGYYGATFYEDRDIRNGILNGRYENHNHAFGFSVGYEF